MNEAFFLGLLIFLQVSIFVNIQFIKSYINNRTGGRYYRLLFSTFIFLIAGAVTLSVMIFAPEIVTRFKFQSMMVQEAGLVFFILIFIKARIAVRIIKRSKDPDYFDISYFGKKVYKPEVVKKSEVAIYIISVPFTLIIGAYFVANIFF